jgi:hypothetical protein
VLGNTCRPTQLLTRIATPNATYWHHFGRDRRQSNKNYKSKLRIFELLEVLGGRTGVTWAAGGRSTVAAELDRKVAVAPRSGNHCRESPDPLRSSAESIEEYATSWHFRTFWKLPQSRNRFRPQSGSRSNRNPPRGFCDLNCSRSHLFHHQWAAAGERCLRSHARSAWVIES